jgi:threonine dehydrogenase-like Zn-dependent dehydrogenase
MDMAARAVVLTGKRALKQETIVPTEIPPDGGWLAVDACGMCGSDWARYALREVPAPFILGHEIVGTVAGLWGTMATRGDLAVGDRVVLEEAVACLSCALCRSGRHRLCRSSSRYGGTAVAEPPALWGGYADAVFLDPRATIHHVPVGLDPVLAALFIPVANGLSWVGDAGQLRAGETVLVLGPGQHGLGSAAAARRLGASRVIVAGRHGDKGRLDAARALGADTVVNIDQQSLPDTVLDITGGGGVDVTIDTTPLSTSALAVAVELAGVGGRIVVAGAKAGQTSPLDTDTLHRRELVVRGVAARESRAVDAALSWLATEPERFKPFGGLTVGLDDVEEALLALGGEGNGERPLHAVVVPGDRSVAEAEDR